MNVAVTGSTVFVSSVDTTGGGGSDLLVYDDSVFQVTGTALDFGENINVVVTGSVAYLSSPLSPTGFDIGARVFNSTGIVIDNTTETSLTFDSERWDTDGIHSGSSSQLYCNTAGKYYISASAYFATDAGGSLRILRIRLNGTTIIAEDWRPDSSSGHQKLEANCVYKLNEGDYVVANVYQNSGGPLAIAYIANSSPEFMMHKIDGGGNAIQIYDDSVFVATGTSISFDDGLEVVSTGTSAFVSAVDVFGYPANGRLTVENNNPVPTGTTSGATTLYYTPFGGDRIALYDGTDWSVVNFTQKSLSLSGISSGTPYDIYGFATGSSVGLESVAWSSTTARATALAFQNGIYVKSGDATRRYLGTIFASNDSQTNDTESNRFVYNYYNRVSRRLYISEEGSAHTYNTGAWRYWINDQTNIAKILIGVVEDDILFSLAAEIKDSLNVTIGIDSLSSLYSYPIIKNDNTANIRVNSNNSVVPNLGYHFYFAAEYGATGADGRYMYLTMMAMV